MRKASLAILICAAYCIAGGESGSRGIVPEEVMRARPPAAQEAAAAKNATATPRYQSVSLGAAFRPGSAKQIGVTIWKLRKADAGDSGARILVQEDNQTVGWIPERVSSGSALRVGDRVRLSIESPEPGYLYVIDRERYASGERGAPYLIFPTTRTRDSDNTVTGGRLIDIPAQDDRPNFFTLETSRADQSGEELTVLLTPKPLEGLQIGPKALVLSADRVANWEKQWSGGTEMFELEGGAGKRWTDAEQRAGAENSRLLTQTDPPPQTIYRVASGPGEPLLVRVLLRYGKVPGSGVK
jgi:Domain of unknown function (DUF4384)